MNKNKRWIAALILGLLLLIILGLIFFSGRDKSSIDDSMDETTSTDVSSAESSLLESDTEDSTEDDIGNIETTSGSGTENTGNTTAANHSPSKHITDQYPDININTHFNLDGNELIEKEEYYILTNASFGYVREADYERIANSDVYISKNAVVHFSGGEYVNGDFVPEEFDLSLEEYFEMSGRDGLRAFILKVDERGWIIEFSDSFAG